MKICEVMIIRKKPILIVITLICLVSFFFFTILKYTIKSPLIENDNSTIIAAVYYNGKDITPQVDTGTLKLILQNYEKKRVLSQVPNTISEIEISVINNHKPYHILLDERQLCYGNGGVWNVVNGSKLRGEVVSLIYEN